MATEFVPCPQCGGRLMVADVQNVVGCHHCGAGLYVPADPTLGLQPLADVLEENRFLREKIQRLLAIQPPAEPVPAGPSVAWAPRPSARDGVVGRVLMSIALVAFLGVFLMSAAAAQSVLFGVFGSAVGLFALFRVWTVDRLSELQTHHDDFHDWD